MKKRIIVPVIILACSLCFADQAAWITKKQAEAASVILSKAGTLRHYCEPCGDGGYRTEKIRTVTSAATGTGEYYEVSVNGEPVDLAYVYVLKAGRWTNLAMLLKIEVSDVSRVMPADVSEEAASGEGEEEIYRMNGMKDFEDEGPGDEE